MSDAPAPASPAGGGGPGGSRRPNKPGPAAAPKKGGPRKRRPRHLPARTRALVAVGVFGVVIIGGVLGGLFTRPSSNPAKLSSTGPAAPSFSLPPVGSAGGDVTLAQFHGRPVVMNFFGSWCGPCHGELPLLAGASRTHPRVSFVGIDVEDTIPAAQAMMRRYGVTYPAGFDPNDRVAGLYAVRGTPTTVFIDAKGRIVKQYAGALDASTLKSLLQQLPSA